MKTTPSPKFNRWHILLLKFLKWLITTANIGLIKVSKGRLGASFLGVPVLLLTSLGRKSGEPRTLPLYYMADGERVVLVASNAGTASDPAWLLNLRANPAVQVKIGEHSRAMLAQVEVVAIARVTCIEPKCLKQMQTALDDYLWLFNAPD